MLIETKRLILRQITYADFDDIAEMLRDIEVMYAWEKTFDDAEILDWIGKRTAGYSDNGYDYLLAVDKEKGIAVGQVGLLKEIIDGVDHIGLGYMLKKRYFKMGYAIEGASACIEYAFKTINTSGVIATIRPENETSVALALRLGMSKIGETPKFYNGKALMHDVYWISRQTESALQLP